MATTISFATAGSGGYSTYNGANANADDGVSTLSMISTGTDVVWTTFSSLSIPSGATINGIEIIGEGSSNSFGNNCDWKVYNGSSWSSNKTPNAHWGKGTTTTDPYVGGSSDLWGLSWNATTAAAIQIQIDLSTQTAGRVIFFDYIKVRITYTAASGYGHTVNGVAAANISKVNGIATASISKVNGI